jgi:hypothetical protein
MGRFLGSKYSDNEKSKVLNSGLVHDLKVKHFEVFHSISDNLKNNEDNGVVIDFSFTQKALGIVNSFSELIKSSSDNDCAWLLINSERAKNKRLYLRTKKVVESNKGYFLTLTFTDKVLNSTTELTRRRYVSRFLKENCDYYVANIDYGTKNGREHYHCVCIPNTDLRRTVWVYGFKCVEKTADYSTSSVDYIKLGRYITKLYRHALKFSNKSSRLIYSRM